MTDIILDSLIDSIKMIPFLFLSYLLIVYIEHTSSKKLENILSISGKWGPVWGSTLGLLPQCGFSITATNLFSSKLITLGTLIAVYISTSDEALPILISQPGQGAVIFKMLLLKLLIAVPVGLVIDYFIKNKEFGLEQNFDNDISSHIATCSCNDDGILKSTLRHTFQIFIYILLFNILIGIVISAIGESNLYSLFNKNLFLQPFISSLIALIPNCISSVFLIELFLNGVISFGSAMAGLITSSGIAIAVLFRVNKSIYQNMIIIFMLYFIGVSFGLIYNFLVFLS